MNSEEPGIIVSMIGIFAIAWIGYVWVALMNLDFAGSISALTAGIAFLYVAYHSAPEKQHPWLFGWNDEPSSLMLRIPFLASLFLGPGTKHLAQWIAPELLEGAKAYVVIIVVSYVAALVSFLYLAPGARKNKS